MHSKRRRPYKPYVGSAAREKVRIPSSLDLTNPTVGPTARENAQSASSPDLTNSAAVQLHAETH